MAKVAKSDVKRLRRFIEDLVASKPKVSKEIELNVISSLMKKVGFRGPENKPGTVRPFSHDLLVTNPMLLHGVFTVHIHGKKVPTILYRDFKQYMLPHIEDVLAQLEERGLIEEDPNV
ncbi:MAG: hypothetical protein E6K56_05515 [Ignavibacteria bacterium]|nr:MAG: hypothetical protein E6K56_05515 [Ignavibacteria bacterium]